MRLQNKVALISGGAKGMGAVEAKLFAKEGAKVVIGDVLETEGKQIEAEINETGGECLFVPLDVTDENQWNEAVAATLGRFGKLDILINNAATNPFYGSVLDADEAAWDKTLDVNLKGPYFMCQHAAKLMRKKGGGSIVNVSSINGRIPMHQQSIYSITKAGLISMTQAFAKELGGENIRVNALLPGLTDTKFASAVTQNEELMKTVLPQIPLG